MSQIKSILIVDDDPSVTFTLSAGLEKLGKDYSVDTCSSAEEALAKFQQHPYTLMITDYRMPGMDGLDLARAVRGISPQTHIIMLTAYGNEELHEQAKQLNFAGVVDKPSTVKQIREIVNRTVAGSERSPFEVLVIEDNDDLRRLYTKALSRAGYLVHSTGVLQEAYDLLDREQFNVLLCDIHIGRDKGTDLIREKYDRLQENKTQIVMITGETGYSDIVEEIGADFLLEKPVNIVDLVHLVSRLTSVETTS